MEYITPLNSNLLHGYKCVGQEVYLPRRNINYRTVRIDNYNSEPITVRFLTGKKDYHMPANSYVSVSIPNQASEISEYIVLLQNGKLCSDKQIVKNTSNYLVLRKALVGWQITYFNMPVFKA